MSDPIQPPSENATAQPPPPDLRPDGTPWPSDVPKGPLSSEDLGLLGTVNSDGEYTSYPVTDNVAVEKLPEEVRVRRANRAKVPKGYKLRVRRKDGKSNEYWQAVAELVMDQTGIAPVDPKVFLKETAAKFAMIKGYTTLQRIEMAITKCEEKLAIEGLSEQLQIEWMTALRGMLAMQKEHLEELKKSADVAGKKADATKPKNLPPFVLQQNFNGNKADELKRVDTPKLISDTED